MEYERNFTNLIDVELGTVGRSERHWLSDRSEVGESTLVVEQVYARTRVDDRGWCVGDRVVGSDENELMVFVGEVLGRKVGRRLDSIDIGRGQRDDLLLLVFVFVSGSIGTSLSGTQ